MKKGKFIVIEGMGGSGKTTCLEFLKSKLSADTFIYSREPGGTIIGDRIRDILVAKDLPKMETETEMLLFAASRIQHVKELILPTLEKEINVITDRFNSSSYAYQICGNQNPEFEEDFWRINEFATRNCPVDLYIFLDLPVEESLRRIGDRARTDNRFDDKEVDYWTRVRDGYLKFLGDKPKAIIDATKSKEEVSEAALAAIEKIIGK